VNTAIRLQTFIKRGNLPDQLNLGSPTRGPPGYIMRPTATFVNYVYSIRIAQLFRRLGIPLIIFLHAACEPAHNNGRGLWPYKGRTPTN
jgi:hypothetical protein